MDEKMKKTIDSMDYESLLRLRRNAPAGSPYFQGDTGLYYDAVMSQKRYEIGNAAHVKASKNIGWDG